MTFVQWLTTQKTRDDPIGDFARDALSDRNKPMGPGSKPRWLNHLRRSSASDPAVMAFHQAWAEFQAEISGAVTMGHLKNNRILTKGIELAAVTVQNTDDGSMFNRLEAALQWKREPQPGAGLKFYCAGKIAKNDWRQEFCLRNTHLCQVGMDGRFPQWPEQLGRVIFSEHHYVGPFFIGDDHGCCHGDETHGMGLGFFTCQHCHFVQDITGEREESETLLESNLGHGFPVSVFRCQRCQQLTFDSHGEASGGTENAGCYGSGGGRRVTRHEIIALCVQAIRRADVVYAWIDCDTLYGTLVELGMASMLRKTIWIAGPTFLKELWFGYALAHRLLIRETLTPIDALRELLRQFAVQQQSSTQPKRLKA